MDKSGAEIMREVESELDANESNQNAGTPPTDDNSLQNGQPNTDKKGQADEFANDEEFQKSVPESFNSNPAWRKLYVQKKELERKLKEFESARTSQPEDDGMELDNEQTDFSEEELADIAQKKGYQLTKADQQAINKFDTLYAKATPEEKQWLDNYKSAIINETLQTFSTNLKPMFQELQDVVVDYRLDKSEKQARKYVDSLNSKYGLTIDYDKDIEPELVKMIKSNPRKYTPANTDVLRMTRDYFAENGIKYGKEMSEKSMRELEEQKRKVNVESSGMQGGKVEDSFHDTPSGYLKDEMKKAGLKRWF